MNRVEKRKTMRECVRASAMQRLLHLISLLYYAREEISNATIEWNDLAFIHIIQYRTYCIRDACMAVGKRLKFCKRNVLLSQDSARRDWLKP